MTSTSCGSTYSAAAGVVEHLYVSIGADVRGLMLPRYPHHIQAGIALPAGEWKQWKRAGVPFVADRVRRFDPIFASFADGLTDLTPSSRWKA